jgi:D-methionine transport system permease protein
MFDSLLAWFTSHGLTEAMFFYMLNATWETIIMTFVSCFFGFALGLPSGILLYVTRPGQILENVLFHKVLSALVNIMRSIPFIIMIFWISPLTNLIVGTGIGLKAVLVPLSIAAAPFMARMVENALLELPYGLIEAARAMGATAGQIIYKVILPESLPSLINSITITSITLVGYSAMGGALGAGGLGQLGYRYGYVTYNPMIMNTVLILLIILVYLIQFIGDRLAKAVSHR